jgi:hypothetical protein
MLSIVGVGMTPPKVPGTPNPASSVMMSRTLGASLGGTMRGAHQGFDCRASGLITPPKAGSGAGSCLPLMVVVALGEPEGSMARPRLGRLAHASDQTQGDQQGSPKMSSCEASPQG